MRTGKNAVLGCVPLIAQPYVVQPYEMLLPYELFGRRVSFEDIASLPEIVDSQLGGLTCGQAKAHGQGCSLSFVSHLKSCMLQATYLRAA